MYSPDWVGEPSNVELHATFCSSLIALILAVPRLIIIAIQRDANPTLLRSPELLVIQCDRAGVAHYQGFPDNPGLCRCIAFRGLWVNAASPGRIATSSVALELVSNRRTCILSPNSQK